MLVSGASHNKAVLAISAGKHLYMYLNHPQSARPGIIYESKKSDRSEKVHTETTSKLMLLCASTFTVRRSLSRKVATEWTRIVRESWSPVALAMNILCIIKRSYQGEIIQDPKKQKQNKNNPPSSNINTISTTLGLFIGWYSGSVFFKQIQIATNFSPKWATILYGPRRCSET